MQILTAKVCVISKQEIACCQQNISDSGNNIYGIHLQNFVYNVAIFAIPRTPIKSLKGRERTETLGKTRWDADLRLIASFSLLRNVGGTAPQRQMMKICPNSQSNVAR